MSKRKIQVGSLEFDQIKYNLKEFLRGQEKFTDFDFEGSNMSMLLDVLAYNTYYNNLHTNFALGETFLDSASKRSSVVSHAKRLGYRPRSSTSSKTKANFTVIGAAGTPAFITIPRYTSFNGIKDGVRFTFYTREDYTTQKTGDNEYRFTEVELTEGAPVNNRFVYTDVEDFFLIPNANIDLNTLVVRVQTPPTNNFYMLKAADEVASIDGTDSVYFVEERENGYYAISFGNGTIGKALNEGDIVHLDYFVSSGELPNGIRLLSYNGQHLLGGTVVDLTMTEQVSGGRAAETIEEIRVNAPNMYASQHRAVTSTDYETILRNKVSEIQDVTVWGGESNMPPIYGKVFISANTPAGRGLTFDEQQRIINMVLSKYKILTVQPEFVNPEFIDVEIDAVVYYEPDKTNRRMEDLKTLIVSAILDYNSNDLKRFKKIVRRTTIARLVENIDSAITSCVPRMRMYRTVTPVYNVDYSYVVNVGNPFLPGRVSSSTFNIKDYPNICHIEDDGNFELKLYANIDGVKKLLYDIGTVNYADGVLRINNLNIVKTYGDFRFRLTPSSSDIASIYNQIAQIDVSKLKVSLVVDNSSDGRIIKGNKHIFTPNSI